MQSKLKVPSVCTALAMFTTDTAQYLRTLVFSKSKDKQNEIAGQLILKSSYLKDIGTVYTIHINEEDY